MPTIDYEIITKITLETREAIANLKKLNMELAKKKKDFKSVATAAKETSAVLGKETKKQTEKLTEEQKKQKELLKKREKAWENLGKTVKRVALVIVAAIGLAMRRFVGWIVEAAKAAVDFQRSMFLFESSVRAMQRIGIDTTIKEWKDLLVELKEQFPIFSEQEIVSALTAVTLKMREYNFTIEEMNNLIQLSGALARATGKDFGELAGQVASAFTRGYFEALQAADIPNSSV